MIRKLNASFICILWNDYVQNKVILNKTTIFLPIALLASLRPLPSLFLQTFSSLLPVPVDSFSVKEGLL